MLCSCAFVSTVIKPRDLTNMNEDCKYLTKCFRSKKFNLCTACMDEKSYSQSGRRNISYTIDAANDLPSSHALTKCFHFNTTEPRHHEICISILAHGLTKDQIDQLKGPNASAILRRLGMPNLTPYDCTNLKPGDLCAFQRFLSARHIINLLILAAEASPKSTFTLILILDTCYSDLWHVQLQKLCHLLPRNAMIVLQASAAYDKPSYGGLFVPNFIQLQTMTEPQIAELCTKFRSKYPSKAAPEHATSSSSSSSSVPDIKICSEDVSHFLPQRPTLHIYPDQEPIPRFWQYGVAQIGSIRLFREDSILWKAMLMLQGIPQIDTRADRYQPCQSVVYNKLIEMSELLVGRNVRVNDNQVTTQFMDDFIRRPSAHRITMKAVKLKEHHGEPFIIALVHCARYGATNSLSSYRTLHVHFNRDNTNPCPGRVSSYKVILAAHNDPNNLSTAVTTGSSTSLTELTDNGVDYGATIPIRNTPGQIRNALYSALESFVRQYGPTNAFRNRILYNSGRPTFVNSDGLAVRSRSKFLNERIPIHQS